MGGARSHLSVKEGGLDQSLDLERLGEMNIGITEPLGKGLQTW